MNPLLTSWLTGMVIAVYLDRTQICLQKNKATGWLGALVRVTNLKFWFMRVRDKMLVFAGVVKKCLQHGHSFRLAGVWLKSENLRFACAVTRFCSSRVKKNIRNLWFSTIRFISGRRSLFQFFPLLDTSGARALVATQKPQSATRQRCDAMSSCRPKCTFFCAPFVFLAEHGRRSPFFQVFPCSIHVLGTSNNGSIGFTPQTTSKMISLSKDILLVLKMIYPPDDHTTACATWASSVT